MILLPAVLAVAGPTFDPIAAYGDFLKAHPVYEVHVVSKAFGKPGTIAHLLLDHRKRLLYESHDDTSRYTLSVTEKGYLEIERSDKEYDEFDYPGGVTVGNSDISPKATTLFPRLLLTQDLKGVFQGKHTITASGANQTLYEKDQSQFGTSERWVTVDPSGQMVWARVKSTGQSGSRDFEWTFSGYKFPKSVPLSAYLTPLPLGYVPHSLQRLDFPLQRGGKAPLDGWVDAAGHEVPNLLAKAGNKPFLIAILAPSSQPSEACRAALKQLKVPVFEVGSGGLKDPDGKRLKVLAAPGSPMFYLIDSKGQVKALWLGFDADQPAKFVAAIDAASSEAAAK